MLQRRGGSSGGKMSSMSWLFVILGVQMVVFLGFVVVFFGFEQRRQGELEEMQGELHRLRRENMRNSNKLMRANTRMLKYEADIKKELDTSVGGANGDYDGADFTPGGDDAGAEAAADPEDNDLPDDLSDDDDEGEPGEPHAAGATGHSIAPVAHIEPSVAPAASGMAQNASLQAHSIRAR